MLSGDSLRDAIISGANNIVNHRRSVDELNVFPVPDGDTGTNMSLTIGGAAKDVAELSGAPAGKVAAVNASALLRGARGNSGVILSLIFRGFAKSLEGKDEIDAPDLVAAVKSGVAAAYKAVMKPTEGTMLTVARVAGDYGDAALREGKDALGVFEAMLEGARDALKTTPDLLPVLKKAGVVDAGGAGFVLILEGMYSVFRDGVIVEKLDGGDEKVEFTANAAAAADEPITFTYCTEFLVKREGERDPKALRAYLETIGDCVVVVDDADIIKVHVHTDHPGNALEKALTFGQLVNLKIENMRDQHERAAHDAREGKVPAKPAAAPGALEPVEPTGRYGFVAVCAGEGVATLFRDLSVDNIVSGGQTMNPSTDDIAAAVEATPAETVFVLPNNKNIIMAAEQAAPLCTRSVIVLPTASIPQGISAMLAFDPDLSPDENALAMRDAYSKVRTGLVTFAARASQYDGKDIKAGDLLALNNGKLSFLDRDLKHATAKLAKSLTDKSTNFLTLIYGEGVSDEYAAEICAAVKAKVGDEIEISLVNGGQPVYYFIISAE